MNNPEQETAKGRHYLTKYGGKQVSRQTQAKSNLKSKEDSMLYCHSDGFLCRVLLPWLTV